MPAALRSGQLRGNQVRSLGYTRSCEFFKIV